MDRCRLLIVADASIPFCSNNNSIELTILFRSHPNRMNRTLFAWRNGNKIRIEIEKETERFESRIENSQHQVTFAMT